MLIDPLPVMVGKFMVFLCFHVYNLHESTKTCMFSCISPFSASFPPLHQSGKGSNSPCDVGYCPSSSCGTHTSCVQAPGETVGG